MNPEKPWVGEIIIKLSDELRNLNLVEASLVVQLKGIQQRKVEIRAEIAGLGGKIPDIVRKRIETPMDKEVGL